MKVLWNREISHCSFKPLMKTSLLKMLIYKIYKIVDVPYRECSTLANCGTVKILIKSQDKNLLSLNSY